MITPKELFIRDEITLEKAADVFIEFAIANDSPKDFVLDSILIDADSICINVKSYEDSRALVGIYALMYWVTVCKSFNISTPYSFNKCTSISLNSGYNWNQAIKEFKNLK